MIGYEGHLDRLGRMAAEEEEMEGALHGQRDEVRTDLSRRAEREAPVEPGAFAALAPRSDFMSLAHEQAEGVFP